MGRLSFVIQTVGIAWSGVWPLYTLRKYEMENKESVYDKRISPLMLEIIRICQEEEMPFFASFEFADNSFCTSAHDVGHSVMKHYRALSQCAEHGGVNVDKYMFWVAKTARVEGHSSIVLHQMGVPEVPNGPN
jgi:hypothetical protein